MTSDQNDTGIEHFRSNLIDDETRRPEFLVGSNKPLGTRVNSPHTGSVTLRSEDIRFEPNLVNMDEKVGLQSDDLGCFSDFDL